MGEDHLSLEKIEASRLALVEALTPLHADSGQIERGLGMTQAVMTFDTIIQTLNGRFGEQSLFSGIASDLNAVAPADDIMAALRSAVAGATTQGEVVDRLDDWFDEPGGGFETLAYLGDPGPKATRRIDASTGITFEARADAPAFRELLKATAMVILSGDPGILLSERDRSSLQVLANSALISASAPMTALRSQTGAAQYAVDSAATGIASEKTALTILRNDMTASDPFEAATALEQVQIQLQTHYSVTARLARLNLAEYLR